MPVKKKAIEQEPLYFDYSKDYKLSPEEIEKLVVLVASEPFRIFEKYLAGKQDRKAHAMISCAETERMLDLRAQIKGYAEITSDMKFFWEQVKRKTEPLPPSA